MICSGVCQVATGGEKTAITFDGDRSKSSGMRSAGGVALGSAETKNWRYWWNTVVVLSHQW